MTKEQNDEQNILKSEVDGEKYPKLSKATELANNYKIRAEKAEAESKELKAKAEAATSKPATETETPKKPTENETPKNEGISSEDVLTLVNAKITHPEDIKEVKDYADYKKIPIGEALKSSVVKNTLKTNEEERKTAKATSTGKGKRGVTKKSIKVITDKANEYKDLESDEDYNALVDARLKAKQQSR